MHRYWCALFPDEFSDAADSDEWVQQYSCEILYACTLFASFIGLMMDFCCSTDRVLIMNSSMGMCANPDLSTEGNTGYQMKDMDRFLYGKTLGCTESQGSCHLAET